jgi:hypothetical protein
VVTGRVALRLRQMGMHEVLSSIHQHNTPTHQRGTETIDGIFTTTEITITDGGYFSVASDHLCLWIDIEKSGLFGHMVHSATTVRRKLHCSDPRLIQKYNMELWKQVHSLQIDKQCLALQHGTDSQQVKERQWEKLDKKMLQLRLAAENKCRKLKMGETQWTPELARMRILIKY